MSTERHASEPLPESGSVTNGEATAAPRKSGDELLVTADSEEIPVLSVVMPTLNEEDGIAECIERIKNALEELQVYGEIIVSDDSTDRTPEIAAEMGARVVHPDGKGYGYAYLYAFDKVRGQIMAMGDADTTYDFEELPKLFRLVESGEADMAMGSRLGGEIKSGAMPPLHQYIGNPFLTRFLNFFYGAGVSDAHSGMRVFTRDAYERMDLKTTGMEFASEMIMEAGARDLTIEELPITYHPREGEATLDSFHDGWRHVRFMLVNAPGYLFSGPGLILAATGLIVMLLALTNTSLGGLNLGVNSMVAGSLFTLVGSQVSCFGAFATLAGEPIREANDPISRMLQGTVRLEHGATAGLVLFVIGASYLAYVLVEWAAVGYSAVPFTKFNVAALTLVVLGVQLVFTSFFLSVIAD